MQKQAAQPSLKEQVDKIYGKFEKNHIGEDYDELAEHYDHLLLEVVGYLDPAKIVEEIKDYLKAGQDTKIVDFGCGTGLVGQHLKEYNYNLVTGIDASKGMLQRSREKACYKNLKQCFISLQQFPEDLYNSFNIVIASGLLSYNHMGPEFFEIAMKALKTEEVGHIVFTIRESQLEKYAQRMMQLEKAGRIEILKRTEFIRYHKTLGEKDLEYFKAEQAFVFVLKCMPISRNILNLTNTVNAKPRESLKRDSTEASYASDEHAALNQGFSTRAVHSGCEPGDQYGGIVPSIDLSCTFVQSYPGEPQAFNYARTENPSRITVQKNLASLENATYSLTTTSGMSATIAALSLLKSDDHLICCDECYGGTFMYINKVLIEKYNITASFVDLNDVKKIRAAIIPGRTKMLIFESPTNPKLTIFDIAEISDICRESNIITVFDNTLFSPYLQNPLDLGVDIVVQSLTKFVSGHHDNVMGCICLNDESLYEQLKFTVQIFGFGSQPFNNFLCLRGVKTLALRMKQSEQSSKEIAHFLENHSRIEKVLYPGLESHPQHELCKRQSRGFGAMIAFYVKGGEVETEKFLKAFKVFSLATSLGGTESLAECVAIMYKGEKESVQIAPNFVRLSIGIEDCEDLIADLKQALDQIE